MIVKLPYRVRGNLGNDIVKSAARERDEAKAISDPLLNRPEIRIRMYLARASRPNSKTYW
jgi:hypothetical protein